MGKQSACDVFQGIRADVPNSFLWSEFEELRAVPDPDPDLPSQVMRYHPELCGWPERVAASIWRSFYREPGIHGEVAAPRQREERFIEYIRAKQAWNLAGAHFHRYAYALIPMPELQEVLTNGLTDVQPDGWASYWKEAVDDVDPRHDLCTVGWGYKSWPAAMFYLWERIYSRGTFALVAIAQPALHLPRRYGAVVAVQTPIPATSFVVLTTDLPGNQEHWESEWPFRSDHSWEDSPSQVLDARVCGRSLGECVAECARDPHVLANFSLWHERYRGSLTTWITPESVDAAMARTRAGEEASGYRDDAHDCFLDYCLRYVFMGPHRLWPYERQQGAENRDRGPVPAGADSWRSYQWW